ncbi:ATP-binding protein [Aquimarina sp. MMG016]|uniref:PAS domain-containing hybrid sensor histidine kinase/response regulator n=1 Tax=Aquimarina sp. MMG016 TaxID=2822690 RepID=UPI001B3A0C24|nr:ATP-binding protein [Aquimarina sp. MMG016]MBQ4820213.1 response regulator [Aquimarina sp. MMG016]
MATDWFKKLLKPNKLNLPKSQEEKEIIDLVDFLWKEIEVPSKATNLKTKLKVFKSLPGAEKTESLPEIYLLLEEHLTEKNVTNRPTKQLIRDLVFQKHPLLLDLENFRLIFQPLREQELAICRVFLSQVLEKSSELVGSYNDPKIAEIKYYLDTPYDFKTINLIKERKNLLEFSNTIFSRIKDSLGINAITNIYLLIYKKHFQSYHLLDSYTATLNVIPEEILAKDLINFPSKQQMLKMLQKQLYSLEEINERLTKEIIERKNVQEELKHSEHLKTTILETAMDGVILVNSLGTVLNWNKQAENILELSREETIGESIYSLVPSKLREQLRNSFRNYIKTGDDQLINRRVETSVNRRDGSLIYVELTIVAIKTKYDYLFNAFFRDITNKKIIDNEIREAKVLAEKSAKAKSIFLSNMSHEIRTPLNVILGLTGILQKSDFSNPDMDMKNLDGIQFSAENLLVLINDVLDFSKIEAGKLSLHKTDFNIYELIKNVSRGFRIKAEEKGLNFRMEIDSSIPKFIIGDQLRLNQILTNLLGNAIKFTHKGEIVIQVKQLKSDYNYTFIDFTVKDTGVGIPKDKLDTIFESFYQVHKPGKDKIEGTGLGLSISKQLIELHNSTLRADSKPGAGSNFNFSIQYAKSKLTSSEISKDDSTLEKNADYISGMNVLIVEDNKMNQFFMQQLFSNWNIKTDIAENGKIALEKLDNNSYDLILMDMHMPVMDGPEAAEIIRKSKNPNISQTPIIACSADVFPESKKRAIDSGMNFYLTKPVSEKELEEILFSLRSTLPKDVNTLKKVPNTVIQEPTNNKKYCDLSFLKETFDNDQDIIKNVLQIFIEDTPNDYKKLIYAIENEDLENSKQFAHKLKSSFKTIGLNNEAKILEKIEHLSVKKSGFYQVPELAKQLDQTYPHIIEEIKQFVKDSASLNM